MYHSGNSNILANWYRIAQLISIEVITNVQPDVSLFTSSIRFKIQLQRTIAKVRELVSKAGGLFDIEAINTRYEGFRDG